MADLEYLDVSKASDWRLWLRDNHARAKGVWLVFHKKGLPTITYDEALDEALAYGWIDSIIRRVDDWSYVRKFTPRQPWSIWSSSNISRVERLKKERRMTKHGLKAFEKRTDEISMLEQVTREGTSVPKDLEDALRKNKKAWTNFGKFGPSHRKRYLTWIAAAKRPETRKRRIDEAVVLISENLKNLLK
jgi:uncharacterized protein YdeI (YjbR/CyaY-like superfamily)